MRLPRTLALALICLCAMAPVAAQTALTPEAGQIIALRKELQRQRKAHQSLRKDFDANQAKLAAVRQEIAEQSSQMDAMRKETARIWAGGAVGFAILFFVLLLIAFRRPRSSSPPDELQQRLAALDRKLREVSPRGP